MTPEDEQARRRWWMPSDAALVEAFRAADPAAAEPVRRTHCSLCQQAAAEGLSPAARRTRCERWRCGLRDPEKFRAEQDWVKLVLRQLDAPAVEGASDEAFETFNAHLAGDGAATIGLARDEHGRPYFGVNASTLRAALHAALVGGLTAGGPTSPRDLPVKRLTAPTTLAERREDRTAWLKQRAAAMRAEGIADKRIAQRLNVDPKTLRNWLGNREEG